MSENTPGTPDDTPAGPSGERPPVPPGYPPPAEHPGQHPSSGGRPPGGPQPPPPPPPPGYGAGYPPPPPAPPPPGHSGSGPRPPTVGDAYAWGWRAFGANLGPILVTVIAFLLVGLVVSLLWNLAVSAADMGVDWSDYRGIGVVGGVGAYLSSLLLTLIVMFVTYVLQAAIVRGALGVSRGERLDLRTMFTFPSLGDVLLAALLVSVLTSLGSLVCGIGALVVWYFFQFTLYFVIDVRQNAVDALRSSAQLVTKNAGTMALFTLAALLTLVIGALLCGVGLVVAIPLVVLAQAFLYRRLLGQPVAG